MADRSNTTTLSIGTLLGIWQVIYFILADAIDAPWNKVPHWPAFDWFNEQSLMFPTMLGLLICAIALVVMLIGLVVTAFVGK